ncbi:ParA family protein [Bradymonas sediminis]|uniref:ParA family protein n=1 Tax=Bradymonas sediminis TaxID=1548548 RepID=A0A2Z4FK91_9DELT|nr:ParA family protein [Bradymonas sediminis]AWV89363.1 ParA family protein [Bradymonas sediminis]TDP73543.1 chromosome partitioning protein [Bradymonas sediminis]
MRNLISNGLKRLVKNDEQDDSRRYARGERQAKVIAVATVKGGVGKTTTAVNLAAGLALFEDARVLLIDLDAQGHCTTSLSALMSQERAEKSVSDILLDEQGAEFLDARVPSGIDGLDVTPADPALAETEGRISQKIGKESLLREALKLTRTHYDYIIIDSPPNKGNLTLNALFAADKVLIPTDLAALSVQGADELMGTVEAVNGRLGHNLGVLGVLLTRVDGRTVSINEQVLEQIEQAWEHVLFKTRIGINTALPRAQLAGMPIFEFDADSRGAKHYKALVHEVVARS